MTPADLHAAVRDPSGDPVPLLLQALVEPEPDIRREAVRYLQDIPTPRAIEPLGAILRRDPECDIRWEAAETLGLQGDPAAVPALLAAITDPEPAVRLCVAEALGIVGDSDPRVAPALCCLLVDFDVGVRAFALEAIGDLGDPIATPAVRTRLIGERRHPEVRVWVYYALARLGDGAFPLTETIALLRRCRTFAARVSAARALARVATPGTLPRIGRALRAATLRERSGGMREAMVRLLAEAVETADAIPPGKR